MSEPLPDTAASALPGQYTDAETGFQYLRARYYDPATGQFVTRDPIEAITREPYGYVGGNPLNGTDPSGLFRIPGTNICIDIADPNCRSIKEQHQEGAQQVANVAGGILDGITLGQGRNIAKLTGSEDNVDWGSGHAAAGRLGGTLAGLPLALGFPGAYGTLNTLSSIELAAQACAGSLNRACLVQSGWAAAGTAIPFTMGRAAAGAGMGREASSAYSWFISMLQASSTIPRGC